MPQRKPQKSAAELRRIKRDAERRRRARIKEDPVKYELAKEKERERRKRRKEQKKILLVADLTPRNQRAQRAAWRERTRKSRSNKRRREKLLKQLRSNTPPTSDDEDPLVNRVNNVDLNKEHDVHQNILATPSSVSRASSCSTPTSYSSYTSRQKVIGAKLVKKNRTQQQKLIQSQRTVIRDMRKKIHSLQVKCNRLATRSNVRSTSSTPIVASCPTVSLDLKRRMAIRKFLEKDENSKTCAGKKDTITRRKIKKQKRLLCDTLYNLHKKYNQENPLKVSYSTFCRMRPFWVVQPKVTGRDTCLCVLHENATLIVEKLKHSNIISDKNIDEVCRAVVCSTKSFNCMMRKCVKCCNKVPNIQDFDNSDPIYYKQWITKKETRLIKGKERIIKRTVKEEIKCQKKELVMILLNMLPKFLEHKYNISHQHKAMSFLKEHLLDGEILVHVDFSENYQCKYASEAQSVHFGASRQQISLHTGVLYYRCESTGITKHICFCSMSECLRHDAAAIYAHLKVALKKLTETLHVRTLHVLSDGPSNQYRNKNSFYFFTRHLVNDVDVSHATWNFSEAGHGKGAPDGVGAVIKRAADAHVAQGNDISDFPALVKKLIDVESISIFTISEEDVNDADKLLPHSLKTIPGTTKLHQFTWSRQRPDTINLRKLTCMECPVNSPCKHYSLGKPVIQFVTVQSNTGPGPSHMCNVEMTPAIPSNSEYSDVAPRRSSHTAASPKSPEHVDLTDNIKEGTWVLARFVGKKKSLYFVGQVVTFQGEEPSIKFTRKKGSATGCTTFVWQEPEDISIVDREDIVCVLPEPTPTRRGELIFSVNIENEYTVM